MKRLNCGVIGLGRLGDRHAQVLAGLVPRARLVAVSDPVKEKLDGFVERFPSVRAFSDYHDLIDLKEIDAVVIASPTDTHGRIIDDVSSAGKFMFCEKPLTLDLEEAAVLEKKIEMRHSFLQVGFMRRFDPAYTKARERLEAGEVGDPVYVRCTSRDPEPPPADFARASGGLFMDLCVHDIDLARWFLASEVTQVYAHGGLLMCQELGNAGDIDQASVLLSFKNGSLGNLEASRNARYGYDVRTEVVCTKGALFVGDLNHTSCLVLKREGARRDVMPWFLERFEKAYLNEINCFVNDILEGRPPSVIARDGIRAVQIAAAAKRSYETGRAVQFVEGNEGEASG